MEVDVDDLVPILERQIDHGHTVSAAGGAGVVDDEIDAAEVTDDTVGEGGDGVGVGDVGDEGEGGAPGGADFLRDRFDVAPAGGLFVVGVVVGGAAGAGEDDVAAGLGQLDGDGPADAAHAPRAGDNSDFAFEASEFESGHDGCS